MVTKIEKATSTFNELEILLRPSIEKVSEVKKRIENLQKGLNEYRKKFEAIEAKLTRLLVESEAALASTGQVKFNDSIFAARQEKSDLETWIDRIKNESLPQAQAGLETTIKELGQKFLEEIDPLKSVYLERVRVIYSQGDAIWDSYLLGVKTMLREMMEKFEIIFPMGNLDQIFVKDFRKLLKKE